MLRPFPGCTEKQEAEASTRCLSNYSVAWRIPACRVIPKTGLMLGLGETAEEIRDVMADLLECRVQILTLGQYLRPSRWHLPVARYYHPDEFQYWKQVGEEMGFVHVESGPLVRSSYLADRQLDSFEKNRSQSQESGVRTESGSTGVRT